MLHSFGGANLDFAVMGQFFRRSGMIFIRRSFQDQPVYKLVLRHYIAWLLAKRFPLSWAFEGTRSRLGKLMPPKYGRSEEHTSELQSLMRSSYAVFCLKNNNQKLRRP